MANSFETRSKEEVERINRLQRIRFDRSFRMFEPPLPEGVPERLERIVAVGRIGKNDAVLDVGSGTGVLVPIIRKYAPSRIYACDLSENMLAQLKKNYPEVTTIQADVKDLGLPDASVDVVFINACYPNIAAKAQAFANIARMVKTGGRMAIAHPLGKAFVETLKRNAPYPLDDFPDKAQAEDLFRPFGFEIREFIDEESLYILMAEKR
jgi:ubiquinone/menaquinone biosynthesis C-methylase UbiE